MTKEVQKLMDKLGISEAEALNVIESDKRIDKGEKLFELTPEQEKAAKAARQADRKKETAPKQREKKVDNEKLGILQSIADMLTINSGCACWADENSLEILNPERELIFTHNGKKYKIVLSAPRS